MATNVPHDHEALVPNDGDDENIRLLKEWFQFWIKDESQTAKPPEALHVRTIVLLMDDFYGKEQ